MLITASDFVPHLVSILTGVSTDFEGLRSQLLERGYKFDTYNLVLALLTRTGFEIRATVVEGTTVFSLW
jgi:hypothetical protein